MSTTSGLSSVLNNVNDAFSGKTSGIDVATVVSELMRIQRAPETQMQNQQQAISSQIGALNTIGSDLTSLYTAVNDLKDVFGALNQKTASSSNSLVLTATATSAAAAGNHNITVDHLATVSSSYSDPVALPAALSGTEIDIAYGAPSNPTSTDKIVLPSGLTSLQQAADAINSSAQNSGVIASVVTDTTGQRLVLVSKNSGLVGNLTVSGPVKFNLGVVGQDAGLVVDGVPVSSSSNTVTGVLTGVTLSLANASPGQPVQLAVAANTSQAATTVGNFVSAYNAVMHDINTQYTADVSGNEGPLAGDSALRTLQSQLLDSVTFAAVGTGQYVNLQSLGLEMQNDGTLQVNATKLGDALNNHYADFQNFFQSASPAGFGQYMGSMLLQATDPTAGTIALDISGLKNTSSSLDNEINDFEARMTLVQQQLTQQYSALNVLLEQYPSQLSAINSQLSALTGSSTSK